MRMLPILLVCPFLQGCFAFGYPSVNQTPPIVVTDPDVKAFRVTRDYECFGHIIAGAMKMGDSIEEIPITDRLIASQRDNYFRYQTFVLGFGAHNDRSVSVYLYRRGFETIVIEPHSWLAGWHQQEISPAWKKAETLEAQEKAIDDLVIYRARPANAFCQFIADEYTAVALKATDESARKRLEEKATRTYPDLDQTAKLTATNR